MNLTGYSAVTVALGLRSLLLSGLMVLLARSFGTSLYGSYATAASIGGFLSTFSGLGAGPLHVREIALGEHLFEVSFDRMIRRIIHTTPILLTLTALLTWLLIPDSLPLGSLCLLALGEYLSGVTSDTWMRSMQSRERFSGMGIAICAIPLAKILLGGALLWSGYLSLEAWAWASFLAGGAAFALICFTGRTASVFRIDTALGKKSEKTFGAIGFAIASASSRVHGDADKVVLTRLASPTVTGQYTIAYRLTDVLTLPIVAGAERLLPRLFKIGAERSTESHTDLLKMTIVGVVLAIMLSAITYMVAPLLPWVFGAGFQASVNMARALSLVPVSMTLWVMVRSYAGTNGFEHAMGLFELFGAGFNVAASLLLVMRFGWSGAVMATYITHISMALTLTLWIVHRRKLIRR
jgi:O-antigen/teichoic acid export membrane protein